MIKNYNLKLKTVSLLKLGILSFVLFLTTTSYSQIASWDFTGENSVVTSTAEVFNPNLDAAPVLTRGAGAAASAGSNSFRTVGFQSDGISLSNTDYFEFNISSAPNYTLSLSSLNARVSGTSSFAVAPGVQQQFAYSLDGTTFTLIGTPTVTVGTLQNLPTIDLSGISALQNVPASSTVYFRFYASGQTNTGGWGFISSASPNNIGLAIGGTVDQVGGCLATSSSLTASACGSYALNSQSYTSSGTYTQTLTNAAGCDSVITLNLTINPIYSLTSSAAICSSSPYIFGTQSLTTSGVYTETFQSISGCDSTVTLTLTLGAPTSSTITATACGSYTANAQTYTTSGTYTQTLTNTALCDSVITLNLTITPAPAPNNITASACDSYTWNTETYTTSGTYTQTIVTASGCDSVVNLTLTINPTPATLNVPASQIICEGETFEAVSASLGSSESIIITGVVDGPLPGGLPKLIELYVINDIADLSIYGLGSATNGGGTDGVEFAFPAGTASAGSYIRVSGDSVNTFTYFGVYPQYTETNASSINGDDAIELFKNSVVIDVFGQIDVDGTGTPWEYLDGWAYRNSNSLPNGGVWDISEWSFSGIDALDNTSTNAGAANPFPIGTYTVSTTPGNVTWYSDATLQTSVGTGLTFTAPVSANDTVTYYVVQESNGCVSDAVTYLAIQQETPATPTITVTGELTFCAGESVLLTSSALNNTWSSGQTSTSVTVTQAGTYTVTASVNGCTATSEDVIVVVNATPAATASLNGNTLTASPSDLTYQWINCDNANAPVAGATNATFTPGDLANYAVIITNATGCADTSACMIASGVGVETNALAAIMNLFPNPTTGLVSVSLPADILVAVQIVDAQGKVISNLNSISNGSTIQFDAFENGIYFIQATSEFGNHVYRIVKN